MKGLASPRVLIGVVDENCGDFGVNNLSSRAQIAVTADVAQ
jgi:hypothetical protein